MNERELSCWLAFMILWVGGYGHGRGKGGALKFLCGSSICIPSSRVEGINFMMTSAEKFTSSSGGGGWVV